MSRPQNGGLQRPDNLPNAGPLWTKKEQHFGHLDFHKADLTTHDWFQHTG